MATIWKFPLNGALANDGSMILEMPKDAEILCVQNQNNEAFLWAKVDPHIEKEARKFYIVGTGKPVPEGVGEYIGTFQMLAGRLVWHLFEGEI